MAKTNDTKVEAIRKTIKKGIKQFQCIQEQAYKKRLDYFTGVWTFGVYTPKVQRICVV